MPNRSYVDHSFIIAGLTLKAKLWRSYPNANGDQPAKFRSNQMRRIIALHGWLDNCGSFDGLASRLNADVLCVDLAGHGLSGFRQHLGAYNVWLDVAEILEVADQLGWQTFELLGHSRGAAIAFLTAATFTQRVESLMCLDGIFPLVSSPEEAPALLFHSINSVKKQLARQPKTYATFTQALSVRQQGAFPLVYEDALALASRGVIEGDNGFYWRYDPKAAAPSEIRFSVAHVKAFANALHCPVLLVLAVKGIITSSQMTMDFIAGFAHWQVKKLPGEHHFHMSAQVEAIASLINASQGTPE